MFAPILTVPGRWHDVTIESTSSRDAIDLTPGAIRSFRIMGDLVTDTWGQARYLAGIMADCATCAMRAGYGSSPCERHNSDRWFGAR